MKEFRLNEFPDYHRVGKGQKPEECPEWIESHRFHTWNEQGLSIWNNNDRKMEVLNGNEDFKPFLGSAMMQTQAHYTECPLVFDKLEQRSRITSKNVRF